MRKIQIWIIAHSDDERVFVQPYPPSENREKKLRHGGYRIFQTEVSLPFGTGIEPARLDSFAECKEGDRAEDTREIGSGS